MRLKMAVLPAIEVPPSVATILKPSEIPGIRGEGGDDFACGRCDATLIEGVPRENLSNLFMICPACKAMNRIDSATEVMS